MESQRTSMSGYTDRSGFPSKFSQLPGINGDTPSPKLENQMMPYGSRATDLEGNDHVQLLEHRVNVAEKSNRALLEEVVRLQGDLKVSMRHHEELIRDERGARSQVENALRNSNELVAQMSLRLSKAEDLIHDERASMNGLSGQIKSLEQSLLGNQAQINREAYSHKFANLKNEVDNLVRAKDQMERTTFTLMDEVRQLNSKSDSHTSDLGQGVTDIRTRVSRLEEETRANKMEYMQKGGNNVMEQANILLRNQVEHKLSELREIVVTLRTKQEQDLQDRKSLEAQIEVRMSQMNNLVSETNRKREEAMHALEVMQREKEHAAETERIKFQGKIAEIAEEVSRRVLMNEFKNSASVSSFEQVLEKERDNRIRLEKKVQEDVQRNLEKFMRELEEKILTLQEGNLRDKGKQNETIKGLEASVELLEKNIIGQVKMFERVLRAEIEERKKKEGILHENLQKVNVALSLSSVEMNERMTGTKKEIQHALEDELQKVSNKAGAMNDMMSVQKNEIQMLRKQLKVDVAQVIRRLDLNEEAMELKRGQEAQQAMVLRELSKVKVWQNGTEERIQRSHQEIRELAEQGRNMKQELQGNLHSETTIRGNEIGSLHGKFDIFLKKSPSKGGPAPSALNDLAIHELKEETSQLQDSLKKLTDSIKTLKTVISLKILSEQNARLKALKDVGKEVGKLDKSVTPLVRLENRNCVMVKAQESKPEDELVRLEINKWSLYTVHRWLVWKEKWLKNRKPKSPPKKKKKATPKQGKQTAAGRRK